MGWKSIDIRCANESCGIVYTEIVDSTDVDNDFVCIMCGETAKRTISAPNVLKASWPDGHREKTANWKDLKEIGKLEREATNIAQNRAPGDRTEIKKELEVKKEVEKIRKRK